MGTFLFIVFVVLAIGAVGYYYSTLSAEELNEKMYGKVNRALICVQCGEKGKVHTKPISKKSGISGGKATAAILTGGVSLLATGLSRKENLTEAHCCSCNSTWHF